MPTSHAPTVEDEDDFDDLDDVLSSITAPPRGKAVSALPTAVLAAADDDASDDFEAELARGMESLLRGTSGTPGPFAAPSPEAFTRAGSEPKMSAEEEEKAWEKAMEMMLSGEGLNALGLDGKSPKTARPPQAAAGEQTYDEKIADIMKNIGKGAEAKPQGDESIADLLAQLGLGGEGTAGLDDDPDALQGLLEGMMGQLVTKEVLESPLKELIDNYKVFLAAPPADYPAEDLADHSEQYKVIQTILTIFAEPTYSDEKDAKRVEKLVEEMQEHKSPPETVLPRELEGLPGMSGENCTIM